MPVTSSYDVRHSNNFEDWKLIQKMWTGEKARSELHRGAYEARKAFKSRKRQASFQPYVRDLISRLVGELFSRSSEVTRSAEVSDDFLADVGPSGESYETQLVNAASTLVAYNRAWMLIDPSQGLRVVEPLHITRSTSNAVVVKGTRTVGESVFIDEQEQDAWTIYYSDRYETYVKSEKEGVEEESVDEGVYEEGFEFSDGPPAVQIQLPWKVNFGLAVARAYRSLFRLKSKYDAALTNALGGGMLQVATGGDDEVKQAIENALQNGAIAVPYDSEHGKHTELNIGTAGLEPGAEALSDRTEELFMTGYRSLQQASKRMSAAEADMRNRGGPGAAMSILARTMESLEESTLPLIAQAEDFRRAGRDLSPEVSWPTDYGQGYQSEEKELTRDIFGKLGLPVPPDAATEVVADRLESNGFEADREAIREEVQSRRDRAEQSADRQRA